MTAVAEADADTAVIVEVDDLEIHETRVEILDVYNELKLVALIEVVSPTNKAAGPGRVSYKAKQAETLARDCHLIEIDLLGHGRHVLCIPEWRVKPFKPFDSLCCVSRWPVRKRFELYPRMLRQRLPRLRIPLAEDDPDTTLDLQVAFEQVYVDGRYWRRVRYDQKCKPSLMSRRSEVGRRADRDISLRSAGSLSAVIPLHDASARKLRDCERQRNQAVGLWANRPSALITRRDCPIIWWSRPPLRPRQPPGSNSRA